VFVCDFCKIVYEPAFEAIFAVQQASALSV